VPRSSTTRRRFPVSGFMHIPMPELCNLTLTQLAALTRGNWKTTGLTRVNRSIPASDLTTSKLLADARTALDYLRDTGPIKADKYHAPAPNHCDALLQRFQLVDGTLGVPILETLEESPHFWPRATVSLLEVGGYVQYKSGRLMITPRGRKAMADEVAGQLFARLVLSLFHGSIAARFFDVIAIKDEGILRHIQATIHLLARHARSPRTVNDLARWTWIRVRHTGPIWAEERKLFQRELEAHVFFMRVLRPLTALGLVEKTTADVGTRGLRPEFSLTPLFDQCFELHPLPPAVTGSFQMMLQH
jgi:hypothetical protein